MNLPRLSPAAERVLARAADESNKRGHPYLGVEHVFIALADEARITFLRVKNSWGDAAHPSEAHRGYLDIYMRYLDGPVARCTARDPDTDRCTSVVRDKALNSAVLPPGY